MPRTLQDTYAPTRIHMIGKYNALLVPEKIAVGLAAEEQAPRYADGLRSPLGHNPDEYRFVLAEIASNPYAVEAAVMKAEEMVDRGTFRMPHYYIETLKA